MPRGREEKTPKKMKQAFLVFCEGATEKVMYRNCTSGTDRQLGLSLFAKGKLLPTHLSVVRSRRKKSLRLTISKHS